MRPPAGFKAFIPGLIMLLALRAVWTTWTTADSSIRVSRGIMLKKRIRSLKLGNSRLWTTSRLSVNDKGGMFVVFLNLIYYSKGPNTQKMTSRLQLAPAHKHPLVLAETGS